MGKKQPKWEKRQEIQRYIKVKKTNNKGKPSLEKHNLPIFLEYYIDQKGNYEGNTCSIPS